jgi:hypothetical protein
MEMDAGLPGHTTYRPDDLSAFNGTSLPIVVWGNGACVNAGNFFAPFLTEISSYGYLVIALGPIIVQLNAAGFPQGPAVPPRPEGTHSAQLIEAITIGLSPKINGPAASTISGWAARKSA